LFRDVEWRLRQLLHASTVGLSRRPCGLVKIRARRRGPSAIGATFAGRTETRQDLGTPNPHAGQLGERGVR
jgi:hypothetical protein